MSSPYIGEIRIFAGNFAPAGWMLCQGQTLAISEYDTLFNLIGTTYGGDGQETFNLPNLQSRIPIHMGQGPGLSNYQLGQSGGVETVTLTTQQLPVHNHTFAASQDLAGQSSPAGNVVSQLSVAGTFLYYSSDASLALAPNSLLPSGGNQPHTNIQPVLALNFIISLFGIYPSPT